MKTLLAIWGIVLTASRSCRIFPRTHRRPKVLDALHHLEAAVPQSRMRVVEGLTRVAERAAGAGAGELQEKAGIAQGILRDLTEPLHVGRAVLHACGRAKACCQGGQRSNSRLSLRFPETFSQSKWACD